MNFDLIGFERNSNGQTSNRRAEHILQNTHAVSEKQFDSLDLLVKDMRQDVDQIQQQYYYLDHRVQEVDVRTLNAGNQDRALATLNRQVNVHDVQIKQLEQCMADLTQFMSMAPKFHKGREYSADTRYHRRYL